MPMLFYPVLLSLSYADAFLAGYADFQSYLIFSFCSLKHDPALYDLGNRHHCRLVHIHLCGQEVRSPYMSINHLMPYLKS